MGTLGAPFEGMKQRLKLEFTPELIEKMLPNDDLDLQVLWLKALEEKGVHINSEHLAEAFNAENVYWPGEYAWFKKNYERGLRPPYTAMYENGFYFEGMGCPIRAEIWGLILPGNPKLAADLCEIDGTLDHYGNSVYFERFWSAMISAAFFERDVERLIETGLKYIPADSRAYRLIADTVGFCKRYNDFDFIRSRLIADYGHCDCTNSFVNIGITLAALLTESVDIIKCCITAVNAGFDTDCTAGNAGALLGLLIGAERLQKEFGFKDSGYALTLKYKRETDKIIDLAVCTARVGVYFLRNYTGAAQTVEGGEGAAVSYAPPDIEIVNEYDSPPYLAPGESLTGGLTLVNRTAGAARLRVSAAAPDGFSFAFAGGTDVDVPALGCRRLNFTIKCFEKNLLREKNIFTAECSFGGTKYRRDFGVIGKTAYYVYGPFWENNFRIELAGGSKKPYGEYIPGKSGSEYADNLRGYHINSFADIDKEYMPLESLAALAEGASYEQTPRLKFVSGDEFLLSGVSAFEGAHIVYLVRKILWDRAQRVKIQIGHNDAFQLYLNGKLLSERDTVQNWTPENVHIEENAAFKAGENILIVRLARRAADPKFSLNFLADALCPPHLTGLNSVIG
jgi:hypothetical protein